MRNNEYSRVHVANVAFGKRTLKVETEARMML